MHLKYGLISADSHVGIDRETFTSRMSVAKWGDRIPQLVEVENEGRTIHRWALNGEATKVEAGFGFGVCNCPALMGEPFPTYPDRWEDVPRMAYDPIERLKALDIDGVDAEILFPNAPAGAFWVYGDAEYELECVRAYNDMLSDWTKVSDRYVPLASPPLLSDSQAIASEIERAVEGGHRGINLAGQMPKTLPHLTDPHWDPIWDVCQQLDVPVHFHGSANLAVGWSAKRWDGFSQRAAHSAATSSSSVTPAQIIPQLIFSGITERFPRLRTVYAENGIGGLNYVMAACDHEWEARHLWTDGLTMRPSDIVRQRMFVNFWFEEEGIKLRHDIGIDNIMWESDFPHVASFYPRSRDMVEHVLTGVPEADRRKLLWANAAQVYGIKVDG